MTSLNSLIEKLATGERSEGPETSVDPSGQRTDPVYVEKLASAIDYIVDSQGVPEQQALETPEEVVQDFSSSIRNSLRTKLAQKSQEGSNETALVQSVLSRLQELKHAPAPTPVEEVVEEKTAEAEIQPVQVAEVTDGSIEDLSLADILNSALGADEIDESAPPSESVKTAEDRGDSPLARKEATGLLKNRLLAKLGQEAGHGTA